MREAVTTITFQDTYAGPEPIALMIIGDDADTEGILSSIDQDPYSRLRDVRTGDASVLWQPHPEASKAGSCRGCEDLHFLLPLDAPDS